MSTKKRKPLLPPWKNLSSVQKSCTNTAIRCIASTNTHSITNTIRFIASINTPNNATTVHFITTRNITRAVRICTRTSFYSIKGAYFNEQTAST
jgi:hypothetical protein